MGIKAELHGKISSTGSNLSESMEDLLTSNVFQLLRYIPLETGLMSILNEAVNIDGDRILLPDGIDSAEVRFWKSFKRSEPDLFIVLLSGDHLVANIMVEAKYLSGKSGVAIYEEEESDQFYVKGSDQLEKEWTDLKEHSTFTKSPFSLIYLTMDWVIPSNDLLESIQAINDQLSRKNIYWLNWQTIHRILKRNLKLNMSVLTKTERIVLGDIIALLAKKGLVEYSGINIPDYPDLLPFNYFDISFYSKTNQVHLTPFHYFVGGR